MRLRFLFLFLWSTAVIPLSAQSLAGSLVKQIIDNPDHPQLAELILKTSEAQANQHSSMNLESVAQRNLFTVMIMDNGQIITRMEPSNVAMIEADFLKFLKNPSGDPRLSDSLDASTPLTGALFLSEGIAIVNYIPEKVFMAAPAVAALARGLSKYRDAASMKGFRVPYQMAPPLARSVIDQYFSTKLVLVPEMMMAGEPPAPPKPPSTPDLEGEVEEEEEIEIDLEVPGDSSAPAPSPSGLPFPGMPDVGDLGEAAEKLKDILFEKTGTPSGGSNPGSGSSADDESYYDLAVVDSAPVMKGCESAPNEAESRYCFKSALERYGANQFVYPADQKGSGTYGKVYLELRFDAEGHLAQTKVLRGINTGIDQAAKAAYSGLPQLSPASVDGQAVAMKCIVILSVQE